MDKTLVPEVVIKEVLIMVVTYVLMFSVSVVSTLRWGHVDILVLTNVLNSHLFFIGYYLYHIGAFNMSDLEERSHFTLGLFLSFMFACVMSLMHLSY